MKTNEFTNKVIKKIKKEFSIKVRETHHTYYDIYVGKKLITRTYISHRTGDLYNYEEQSIKRQLFLNNLNQLYDLKNCPMSAKDYKNLLLSKNKL